MSKRSALAIVVLAAGKGERMRSETPKVLTDLLGGPLVDWVLDAARGLSPERTVVVVGYGAEAVKRRLAGRPVRFARQAEQHGTGHAVLCARRALAGFAGTVLVLYGDVPLVRTGTLRNLLSIHRRRRAAASLLTASAPDPRGYGRILRDEDSGRFAGIREEKDASPAEKRRREISTGIMAVEAKDLWSALRRVGSENAQGEQYLTDVPGLLARDGARVETAEADFAEVCGVNSASDLAAALAAARGRVVADHLAKGVRILDPATTWIDRDVTIGAGTVIQPFTAIRGGTRIGRDCEIGPFATLRAGTEVGDGAAIGNFVEVKKSVIGAGAKAKHLTYLGDATVGAGTNVGCGTITANYDGSRKHRTVIGREVHVGSGTIFVAPVTVGDGAVTGAGAVVLRGRDVGRGETVAGVPARPIRRGR
jgi:bifunctional UDP-N-acetylglucosamine pyrophosphorylase/glucosamine-1-phosphate N-acetyltransferase